MHRLATGMRWASHCLAGTLILGLAAVASAELPWPESQSLPPFAYTAFAEHREDYGLSVDLNPYYQRGDFDGDGKLDVAVYVVQTETGKKGIAVILRSGQVTFLGAGSKLGNGGDDFDWMGAWQVREECPDGDGLYVIAPESASALLCRGSGGWTWHQRGD